MNLRAVFHLIALMLLVLAVAMCGCWAVALFYGDAALARHGLLWSAGITGGSAALLLLVTRGRVELSRRDGFGIVTFGWLVASLFGALPYLLGGTIASPVAAVFETMSGFTTTGASVLTDLEAVPRGILFWRALTHWFGGMGVLVLMVAILPFLGVGGMQIFRAEMPGPSKDRLTPRIASTAKLLWGVYALLTLVLAGLLWLGGMSAFDSLCHTFATMATGGFSTRTASIGAYDSAYFDVVLSVFMFLAGCNFSLHYRALTGAPLSYFRDSEFRYYLGFVVGAGLFLSLMTWQQVYASFADALRAGFFQTISIMTTTGFISADFDLWPDSTRFLLILLMFIGGCAGSTGGGIKVMRIVVVLQTVRQEIRRYVRPNAVLPVKVQRKAINAVVVSHISAFFAMFMLLFGICTFLMTFFTPDLVTAFSAVIATMGNIGPGLAAVGATQTYAPIPDMGKLILILCMLLGRLELYTVLIVLLPSTWRR